MATRRKAVTRSSSVSTKRKQPERHEVLLDDHQLQLETPAKSQEEAMPCSPSPTKKTSGVEVAEKNEFDGGWSTPKAKRFRIPEVDSCPPAPKKQRVKAGNCSLRRSSIPFFTQPELAEFFFSVTVPNMSIS